MELAHMVEDKIQMEKQRGDTRGGVNLFQTSSFVATTSLSPRSNSGSYAPSPRSHSGYSQSGVSTGSSLIPRAKPIGEVRRLSENELQEKRSKGLCFKCDEKWNIGHKCQRRELSVLLTQEENSGEEENTLSEFISRQGERKGSRSGRIRRVSSNIGLILRSNYLICILLVI